MEKYQFDTIAVTGGFLNDPQTGVTNVPIYLSNAYQFKDADNAAGLFNLTESGYIYTRMHNPTTTVLEERVAALEGGVAAVATSTGHFAELAVFSALCKQGDEIISSSRIYGGTINLFSTALTRFGIKTHFIDQRKPESCEALINENTKLIYLETLANPDSSIPDFEEFAKIAKKYKIPLIIDNTMATPYLFRPVETGANIVIHSTSKYLCGNASVMGGVVVDLGNFDWAESGRFPQFVEPDNSYHGLSFAESFGSAAFAAYLRTKVLRDFGGTPSPFNSFLTIQGIQTLHLRIPRCVENTQKIAKFLSNHSKVKSVSYPELENHIDHKIAKKYFTKGVGGLLTFETDTYETAKKLINSVKLCIHAVNVGDSRTVLTHPASTTHRQASEEQLKAAGISKCTIRVSAGLEDINDIIADISKALQ